MMCGLVNLDDLDHNRRLSVQTLAGLQEISLVAYEADYLISVVPPKRIISFRFRCHSQPLRFVKPEEPRPDVRRVLSPS